jgi:hypothetical protein
MAWPENLTAAQQANITNFVDQVLRPTYLNLVKALAAANIRVIPGYLASPSGAASTFASPAADSIAGLLAGASSSGLVSGDVVPLSAQNPTGLALAQPLTVGNLQSDISNLNTMLTTYWQLAAQEGFSNVVGAPNMATS